MNDTMNYAPIEAIYIKKVKHNKHPV